MEQREINPLPQVVLIGRPNVGKSSLFNAFLGRRRSITDSVRGVTRDPVAEIYTKGEVSFFILDTGGFTLDSDEISKAVREKTFTMIARADIIVFVVDVMEWTGEDKEVLDWLRPYADKIILAVNKVDTLARENRYYEFLGLGVQETYPVSATHSRGLQELKSVIESRCAKVAKKKSVRNNKDINGFEEGEVHIRIVIVGRPNTGKSTLINYLCKKQVSIVSSIAGTTRDVIKNEFKCGKIWYEIWDTAGIRRKSKVCESVEYYSVHRAIESIAYADVVYLLVGAQEDLSSQDKKIAYQAVKRGKPIILCLSKWDLLKEKDNLLKSMVDRVRFLFPVLEFAPIVPISSLKGEGIEDLFQKTHRVYKELYMHLETSRLNNALKTWMADFSPPRPFKVKFLNQVSINPVKFLLFVNQADNFPESYISYIRNKIRSLGHAHIPFEIIIKAGS